MFPANLSTTRRSDTSSPGTRLLFGQKYTHTHTFGIRFSASRADQFIDVVEEGKGRVTPWYLSPVPPGAWPKSNVVKIEIIRATTFHGNRVHPSTVSDPDNPQRPQPVNILQASFRRLEPEGVAPWRVAVTELSPPLTTRHPFSASLFGYLDAVPVLFTFKFLGHVDEGFFAHEFSFRLDKTKLWFSLLTYSKVIPYMKMQMLFNRLLLLLSL